MNQSTQVKKSPPVFLICLALFGIPAVIFAWNQDYVTAVVLVLMGNGCLLGFKVGAIRRLATVAGIFAAVWFTPKFSGDLEPKLTEWFSTTGLTNHLLSMGLIGISIVVVTVLLVGLISSVILKRRHGLNSLNRWTGFLMGGAEAGVGVLLVLGGLIVIQPMLPASSDSEAPVQNAITSGVAKLIERTESSYVGPVVEKYNPFVKFPQLNRFAEVQNTFVVLQDPAAVKKMIYHPRIKALQDDPEMKDAIDKLKSDKTINKILKSGGPDDVDKVMAIMNSPVVLHLLNQPGFIAKASEAIAEMNQDVSGDIELPNSKLPRSEPLAIE